MGLFLEYKRIICQNEGTSGLLWQEESSIWGQFSSSNLYDRYSTSKLLKLNLIQILYDFIH